MDAPATNINAGNVFESEATAISALTGIFTQLAIDNQAMSGLYSIPIYSGLAADEYTLSDLNGNSALNQYYKNSVVSTTSNPWGNCYTYIYNANAAIEGLGKSTNLDPIIKKQLLGEAYFIRAYCYFYLVNLYGDVPLALTTDYKLNAVLARTTKAVVFAQIIADLKLAQGMLSEKYLKADAAMTAYAAGVEERVRPTRYAAGSLLSRTYLYMEDYANAEIQASSVIDNQTAFGLVPVANTFLKNNRETIWAIQPTGAGTQANTGEGTYYIPITTPFPSATKPLSMNPGFISSIEAGDLRLTNWLKTFSGPSGIFYYPYKYKIAAVNVPVAEYSIVLRLAEQFLIRAEARAKLNKLAGAALDLKVIRDRAGLGLSTAVTQSDLLTAIAKERRIELFAEWGHRWMDLKRTKTVDEVMTLAAPAKGSSWNSNWSLWPIPLGEIQTDANLVQNPGYN